MKRLCRFCEDGFHADCLDSTANEFGQSVECDCASAHTVVAAADLRDLSTLLCNANKFLSDSEYKHCAEDLARMRDILILTLAGKTQ